MNIIDLQVILKPKKSDQRIILAAPKVPLAGLKSSVKKDIIRGFDRYARNGKIDDLSFNIKSALDDAYANAYMLGKKSNSVSKREKSWIDKQKQEQFNYLDGFMTDLDADASTMEPTLRMNSYLKKLDGMYWSGFVAGADDGSQITWALSAGNNCDDCIAYADGSPYNRDELDAVPGDGSTACLFNCGCWLENDKDERL